MEAFCKITEYKFTPDLVLEPIKSIEENKTENKTENNNSEKKLELLQSLLKVINIEMTDRETLNGTSFERDILLTEDVIHKYYSMIKKLKTTYTSDILTCLHVNSVLKQKFPAINMLRQMLKCNNFKLKPVVITLGYSGNIKLVKRYFKIIDTLYFVSSSPSGTLNSISPCK